MKTKQIQVMLWLLTIAWLLLIFTLSSQNRVQTVQTSGGIAEKTAEVIYQQPTEDEVDQIPFSIRKLAHVSLFFILGALSFSASATTFGVKNRRKYWGIAVAVILTSAYGFFDEWHKQFIGGRHFQLNEVMLNIISGVTGALLAALICMLVLKFKKKLILIKSAL